MDVLFVELPAPPTKSNGKANVDDDCDERHDKIPNLNRCVELNIPEVEHS